MTLFSWFTSANKAKTNSIKNAHLSETISSFNASTMWPIAKVRRNIIVKQQQGINATKEVDELSNSSSDPEEQTNN